MMSVNQFVLCPPWFPSKVRWRTVWMLCRVTLLNQTNLRRLTVERKGFWCSAREEKSHAMFMFVFLPTVLSRGHRQLMSLQSLAIWPLPVPQCPTGSILTGEFFPSPSLRNERTFHIPMNVPSLSFKAGWDPGAHSLPSPPKVDDYPTSLSLSVYTWWHLSSSPGATTADIFGAGRE